MLTAKHIALTCRSLHVVLPHLNLLRKPSRCLLPAIASFSFSLSRLHLVMYFLSANTASPLWQLLPSSVVIAYNKKHTGEVAKLICETMFIAKPGTSTYTLYAAWSTPQVTDWPIVRW
jgi:hypothetical protein